MRRVFVVFGTWLAWHLILLELLEYPGYPIGAVFSSVFFFFWLGSVRFFFWFGSVIFIHVRYLFGFSFSVSVDT